MEEDKMEAAMRDQHRLQLLRQLQMERMRAQEAEEKGISRQDAKRSIAAHTRSDFEDRRALAKEMVESRDQSRQILHQRRLMSEQQRQFNAEDKEQRRLVRIFQFDLVAQL